MNIKKRFLVTISLAVIILAILFATIKVMGGARFMSKVALSVSPWVAAEIQKTTAWLPYDDTLLLEQPFVLPAVWGYTDRQSIDPGESFQLMLGHSPTMPDVDGYVIASRIGMNGKEHVSTSSVVKVVEGRMSVTAGATGAGWAPALRFSETRKWRSGYYTFDFVQNGGHVIENIGYLVVKNQNGNGQVLVKLGTNTYQAYNRWGGISLYSGGARGGAGDMVSFDRPTPADFFRWDVYLIRWIEALGAELGFSVDYATNFDIHSDEKFTKNYPLVIVSGHDEYWSEKEFRNFHKRIFALGKNTMFFGGNLAYYNIRYSDVNGGETPSLGRQILAYKASKDPYTYREKNAAQIESGRFDKVGLPTRNLLGLQYSGWFQPKTASNPSFNIFAADHSSLPFCSEYVRGESAGPLLGYEWDSVQSPAIPDAQPALIPSIGAVQTVFRGEALDKSGQKRPYEAVYFRSPAGAKVFSAGTIQWNWGLGRAGFSSKKFQDFNRALVIDMLGSNIKNPQGSAKPDVQGCANPLKSKESIP